MASEMSELSYLDPSTARRVRDLISWAGLTIETAAHELEVPENTIRNWCSPRSGKKAPRMALLALERLTERWRRSDAGPT